VRHKQVLADEEIPPDYPRELETSVALADGRRVWIRPVAPSDHDGLSWEIAHADNETLYLRFFTRAIRERPDFVRTLVNLDYRDEMALTAIGADGEGAGVARYVRTDEPDVAQVAVVVAPDWRNTGLATLLLDLIQRAAWDRGIRHFTAVYLAENAAVDALRGSRGLPEPVVRHGLAELNWELKPPAESET
jgi:GNAT superfamily N-acetyltransferase